MPLFALRTQSDQTPEELWKTSVVPSVGTTDVSMYRHPSQIHLHAAKQRVPSLHRISIQEADFDGADDGNLRSAGSKAFRR